MSSDLRSFESYEAAVAGFEWGIPERYNLAADVSDRHRDSEAVAARSVGENGVASATFAELAEASASLASSFEALGLGRGSRICMAMTERIEALVVFLAIAKIGGVAITLRRYDSTAAYEHELSLAAPDAIVCERSLAPLFEVTGRHIPVLTADADTWPRYQSGEWTSGAESDLGTLLAAGDAMFETVETHRDVPVMVSFTSGSTGLSKGVVQAHRVARGACPAFQMATNVGPYLGDVFFNMLGWATMGGLRSLVLPAWQYGLPVVAADMQSPTIEDYCELLSTERVSVAYLMPSVLKQFRQLGDRVNAYDLSALRVVITAGEGIGGGLRAWIEAELGVALHAYYGQTEMASVVSTCQKWFPSRDGSIGRLVPGHSITLVNADSSRGDGDSLGTMTLPADDPGLFVGYITADNSRMPEPLAEPYVTEDVAQVDEDGYFYYLGREGEVIELAGGRVVAAAELEDVVSSASGVADAAAIMLTTEQLDASLVMCIETQEDSDSELQRIVDDVSSRIAVELPSDAHPDSVAVLRAFPKTKLTNKVNRKLLRAMVSDGDGVVLNRSIALTD